MDILKCRNRILYIFVLKIQGIFLMFFTFICYYVYRICVNYFDKEERGMTAGFDLSQEMETFARGENFHAQTFLGAHPATKAGYVFRVWAPKAQQIWLVGEFNDWQEDLPMKLGDHGIWSVVAPNAKHGQMYKFKSQTT